LIEGNALALRPAEWADRVSAMMIAWRSSGLLQADNFSEPQRPQGLQRGFQPQIFSRFAFLAVPPLRAPLPGLELERAELT
jgi:hypothetical protein